MVRKNVVEILTNHVTFGLEAIDRMDLDVMSVDESRTFDVAIEDILMMTPNAWHLTDAHRCRAAALTRVTVTVSFRVAVLRQARQATNEDERSAITWRARAIDGVPRAEAFAGRSEPERRLQPGADTV